MGNRFSRWFNNDKGKEGSKNPVENAQPAGRSTMAPPSSEEHQSQRQSPVTPPSSEENQSQRQNPETLEPSELLVAVVGYTGSGMSQFIDDVTEGSYSDGVGGTGFSPKTKEIQKVQTTISGRRITFIDMPGFNYVEKDECAAFIKLNKWLRENYSPDVKLAGIIYMQNITNSKLYQIGSEFKVDDMDKYLKDSCGSDWPTKTVFVCSHWDEEPESDRETKEEQLRNGYWRSMVQENSPMKHFGPVKDFGNARSILSSVIRLEG